METTRFVAKSATRARNTYLAVGTPAEFFANPDNIVRLSRDVARRYVRTASFLRMDDTAQAVSVVVMECALPGRWKPESGVPFGGFAFKSAVMWMIGEMYRGSVPVSGHFATRADVEGVRYDCLDAPAASTDGTSTLGALTASESVIGGASYRPDDAAQASGMWALVSEATAHMAPEVADAVLAVMHGVEIPTTELPAGYTAHGLAREAARLRETLRHMLTARVLGYEVSDAPNDAPPAVDMDDPWLSR